jgi:hypothetical protein
MALNSRQRRAAKFNLGVRTLAKTRNPPVVASEGRVRSTADKRLLILPAPRAFHANGKQKVSDTSWEGRGQRVRVHQTKVVADEWKDSQARDARLARETDASRQSRAQEMHKHKADLNALSCAPPLRK